MADDISQVLIFFCDTISPRDLTPKRESENYCGNNSLLSTYNAELCLSRTYNQDPLHWSLGSWNADDDNERDNLAFNDCISVLLIMN